MGRLHCLGNHMMQTMGSDIAPVQGASVQLYHEALRQAIATHKLSHTSREATPIIGHGREVLH